MVKLEAPLVAAPFRSHPIWPFFALAVMGIGWGGSFSLLRLARLDGAPAIGVAFYESFGAGALLLLYMLARRAALPLDRIAFRFYLVSGFFGVGLPVCFVTWSAAYLPVGILSLAMALSPILTYSFSLPFGVERFAPVRVAGIVAGLAGIALVLLPETSLPERSMTGFAAIAFASTVCYAIQNVYIARAAPLGLGALAMSAGTLLVGGGMLIPLMLATDSMIPLLGAWGIQQWAVAGMILVNAVCTIIFLKVILSAGPLFGSLTAYTVTLSGILWGVLLFGERFSLWIWGAVALLFVGVGLVGMRRPPKI
jgi:drug/metabolite transporter (DMT)-like permease